MQPLRVFLVCSFGISTSLLVQSMQEVAAQKGIPLVVDSGGTDALPRLSKSEWDVILLGPQVRYAEAAARRTGLPVGVVDGFAYATANGETALAQAMGLAGWTP
jgi:PTS system cellobiose-specific IIB component